MYADLGHASINLRDQVVNDLTSIVQKLQSQGHDIVIMADLNEASGHGSASDRLCFACNLTDAHTLSTSASAPPPTYHRGSQKIDYVLISPRLRHCVVGVSILALHDGYISDHRSLIVDFDANFLFAGDTSPVVLPSPRRLTSTNPNAVHTYVHTLLQFISKHNLTEKITNLSTRSDSGVWTEEDTIEWERLDCLLVDGRLSAEKKCSRKNSGKHPWSPELARAGKTLHYWRMRLSFLATGHTNTTTLGNLETTLDIPEGDRSYLSGIAIRQKARSARRALSHIKKQAASLRAEHLQQTATLLMDLYGLSKSAACNAIAHREKSSAQFRQLRSVFNTSSASGLDRIDVPDEYAVLRQGETVPRIPLVTKEEIEEVLVPHTFQRFCQHCETPFETGARKADLGQDCTSSDAQQILEGTYDRELESLSDEAVEWIRQLQTKEFVKTGNVISTKITTDDYISGWKKMRESTASAPGSHYGHYKTISVAARLPESHEDHSRELAALHAMMISMPLAHGFAPTRWQSCIDAILEKIPGKPVLEKLRVIMLYEADFNFVLKLIWGHRLVRHAEKYQILGLSNHGSRPGRQTKDAHMEKLLLYENARLTSTSLITMDNDAKSCYDRIIKTLALLACIGVGLPIMAATMHNRTHSRMSH